MTVEYRYSPIADAVAISDETGKSVVMEFADLENIYNKVKEQRRIATGVKTMRFGEAIELCRQGKIISRKDWNGKDMFVYFVPEHNIPIHDWHGDIPLTHVENGRGYVTVKGHFDMYNAQGQRIIGWLASQTDMYSDQWFVVEGYLGPDGFHTSMETKREVVPDEEEDDLDDHARNQYPNRR